MTTNELVSVHRTSPLLLGAAVAVMVLCAVGIAAISGVLPSAWPGIPGSNPAASGPVADPGPQSFGRRILCETCGTVASIRRVELRGDSSGLGAVAGGVTGALVGSQMGRGRGNTAMTILGAAGGAFAGNEIESQMKRRYAYQVTVRMEDGSSRTISQGTPPKFAIGDKVRVVDGTLVARS